MKRNWKRVLSLLLSAAMVFTMNATVFADEAAPADAAAPVAVEEASVDAVAEAAPAAEVTEEAAPAEGCYPGGRCFYPDGRRADVYKFMCSLVLNEMLRFLVLSVR